MFKYFCSLVILLSSVGCATITPVQPGSVSSERVFAKNYSINEPQVKFIGEAIVSMKDFMLNKSFVPKLKASQEFKVIDQLLSKAMYVGAKDSIYPIVGQMEDAGTHETLNLIRMPNTEFLVRYAINESGYFNGTLVGAMNQLMFQTLKFVPDTVKFQQVVEEEVDMKSLYVNFEIIFTGMTNQSINMLYREYTPDNLAKPAFYQNLTFPTNSTYIRFKNVKIRIEDIDTQQIKYTVLTDGVS